MQVTDIQTIRQMLHSIEEAIEYAEASGYCHCKYYRMLVKKKYILQKTIGKLVKLSIKYDEMGV